MIGDLPPSPPPVTLYEVQHIYEMPSGAAQNAASTDSAETIKDKAKAQKNEAAGARSQAIYDTALGLGVKAGLAWQLTNINNAIHKKERDLDTDYDFGHYMIKDRVVPAVITEARDLYNQDGDFALRLSGAYYTIAEQPRFSSVPPSWREYLDFPVPELHKSLMTLLLPKNDEERHIWQLASKDGWKQGVDQANLMLNYGLDRLNRDFVGMLRFHEFVIQGKITMPAIASEAIPLTKAGYTMALDEQLLRITTLPEFQSNMDRWSTSITPSGTASPSLSAPIDKGNAQ